MHICTPNTHTKTSPVFLWDLLLWLGRVGICKITSWKIYEQCSFSVMWWFSVGHWSKLQSNLIERIITLLYVLFFRHFLKNSMERVRTCLHCERRLGVHTHLHKHTLTAAVDALVWSSSPSFPGDAGGWGTTFITQLNMLSEIQIRIHTGRVNVIVYYVYYNEKEPSKKIL